MKPGSWKRADEPGFLAHALTLSAAYGPGPWPQDDLPDEPPRTGDGPFFASGALDGIRTHHASSDRDAAAVGEVAGLMETLARAPDPGTMARLHDLLADTPALSIADDLVTELHRRQVPAGGLHAVGRELAEYGTRREAVKLGIVLVGACGDEHDRDLLLLLGALEEFTLYAVVALLRSQPDGERAVYELARRVDGWGRIHAVERLRDTGDPEIRDWLLREGWRNGVMNEYLAPIAAQHLYEALLDPDDPDDDLVAAAADVLATLVDGEGGPSSGISSYPDAIPALARLATLVATAEPTLALVNDMLTITAYLRRDDLRWPELDVRTLRRHYEALAARADWREPVLARLAEPGGADFGAALNVAGRLGLRAVPQALAHLRAAPDDDYSWYTAIRMADHEEAAQVAEAAAELLPLAALTTGPGRDLGIGPEYSAEMCLELVVGGLEDHPGVGTRLLAVALRNRVVRLRWGALRVLTAWDAVPGELLDVLRAAAEAEPEQELRRELRAFVASGRVTPPG
ncbi:hypothetical protein [Nonomuraea aridisoli]|uniref:Uncharacterized protein n=1 Tax=Nonomuraea aridisoli TaxID=2070368 RepID=A0A2W2E218_9ACTN|nr:hypothetical protein [Nonomuraea aridisoli]PZG16351.1 hypothetical protein C1J01_21300 [Nonomuraea aridisoli]